MIEALSIPTSEDLEDLLLRDSAFTSQYPHTLRAHYRAPGFLVGHFWIPFRKPERGATPAGRGLPTKASLTA